MSKLQVETISHTNNTTGMTIDSSGRILTPPRPSFKAKPSATATLAATNVIVLDDVTSTTHGCHNVGGHYSTSTGKFTAPLSGVYVFMVSLYTNDATDCEINFVKTASGTEQDCGVARIFADGKSYDTLNWCGNVYMNANETGHFKVHSGTAYYNVNVSSTSGYLLG